MEFNKWPDAVRLEMIRKQEYYHGSEKIYGYGYYDGYQKAIEKTCAPEMLEAMKEFCVRVEKGEIRSRKTYNKFKQLIKKATTI